MAIQSQKTFFVVLSMTHGEYETRIKTAVKTTDPASAAKHAIAGLLRCEIGSGAEEGDDGIYDCNGELHYRVVRVQELEETQAGVLAQLQL